MEGVEALCALVSGKLNALFEWYADCIPMLCDLVNAEPRDILPLENVLGALTYLIRANWEAVAAKIDLSSLVSHLQSSKDPV
jgi:hypothetical protein